MSYGNPAARSLPDFPWDRLIPFADIARSHPDGIIDLSIGTPVDPTPSVIQAALAAASDAPGYPTTVGLPELRQSAVDWFRRCLGVSALDTEAIIPTIGSKEIVAWLPTLLGLTPRDAVAIPTTAYPTYDVGARIAGCAVLTADTAEDLEVLRKKVEATGRRLAMVWVNSPSNPTGRVLTVEELRSMVAWGRDNEVLVVSDECYLELGWDVTPTSVLHPDVIGASLTGVLAVHSLSKRSNLAGYRAGVVAGDKSVIAQLLEIRKHAGMILPTPVQRAAIAAFNDDEHVAVQRERYRARRDALRGALTTAGFEIHHSNAGLYLWATRGENCWQTVEWLAQRGVLVAPGSFYGAAGEQFVRVALTATDERIARILTRLS